MQQVAVLYDGSVQGVGFRYSAQRVATHFAVTGYVRNLDDGRVELVAEGEAEELTRFLDAVRERMAGCIRDCEERRQEATGKYKGFHIAP